jgi:hypothetical protein
MDASKTLLLFLLAIKIPIIAQDDYKNQALKDCFNQEIAGNKKDYCTIENVKSEIEFSGYLQRVAPPRASNLNRLIKTCDQKLTQDWTGGTTEILAIEDGQEYWLQIDVTVDNQSLNNYKSGDKLILFGQVICKHSYNKSTTFYIVKKIIKIK